MWPINGQIGPKLVFLAKYWHFWPIWSHARPINNASKVPRWFFCYVVTKTFASPHKNQDFWPQNGQIWSKICIFGHFGPHIGIFCPFDPMPDQKTLPRRCLCGFSVMWVTKHLISPVKIRSFAQKQPNLA